MGCTNSVSKPYRVEPNDLAAKELAPREIDITPTHHNNKDVVHELPGRLHSAQISNRIASLVSEKESTLSSSYQSFTWERNTVLHGQHSVQNRNIQSLDVIFHLESMSQEQLLLVSSFACALDHDQGLPELIQWSQCELYSLFAESRGSCTIQIDPEWMTPFSRYLTNNDDLADASVLGKNGSGGDNHEGRTASINSMSNMQFGYTSTLAESAARSQQILLGRYDKTTDEQSVHVVSKYETCAQLLPKCDVIAVPITTALKNSTILMFGVCEIRLNGSNDAGCATEDEGTTTLGSCDNNSTTHPSTKNSNPSTTNNPPLQPPTSPKHLRLPPREPLDHFPWERCAALWKCCQYLGSGINLASLNSERKKKLQWANLLLQLSKAISAELNAPHLVKVVIDMLKQLTGAERGSLYLLDDSVVPNELWTMVSTTNGVEELKELRFKVGVGVAGHVAATQQTILISDAYSDDRFDSSVDKRTGLKTTSMICIPVMNAQSKLVGVAQMINKRDVAGAWTGVFDEDDLDLLLHFSTHVGIALQNAKTASMNKYNEYLSNTLLRKMFPAHILEKLKKSFDQENSNTVDTQELAFSRGFHHSTSAEHKSKMRSGPFCARNSIVGSRNPVVEEYNNVLIFFSDIVSFTTYSATKSPETVINMLNDLFTVFDLLSEKHGVYKVETIGDAYMVASNLPFLEHETPQNAINAILNFATDVISAVEHFRTREGQALQIRVGMHCGPCFGGIIGRDMPRFCLMGDTVNTASRMESNGQPMRIHISDCLKRVVEKNQGSCSTAVALEMRTAALNGIEEEREEVREEEREGVAEKEHDGAVGHVDGRSFTSSGDEEDEEEQRVFEFVSCGEKEIKGKGLMQTWFLELASSP